MANGHQGGIDLIAVLGSSKGGNITYKIKVTTLFWSLYYRMNSVCLQPIFSIHCEFVTLKILA